MLKNKLHVLVDALPEDQIETAENFLDFLVKRRVRTQSGDDLKILNENSKSLNEEAADVLTYQIGL